MQAYASPAPSAIASGVHPKDPTALKIWIADSAMVQRHVTLLDGKPLGYIQSDIAIGSGGGWWKQESDPGVRGIDQSIADAAQLNPGLGTAMVRAFVKKLFENPQVARIQTDPDPRNARAIRCYENCRPSRWGKCQRPMAWPC